jgi:hypothetical protein
MPGARVTGDERPASAFGCVECWPADADAAWKARPALRPFAELIDESHFRIVLLACPRCSQRFLSVFTEMIDWEDGDDPQEWTVLPLIEAEAEALLRQEVGQIEGMLMAIGPVRRSLRRVFPKGGPDRIFWSTGVSVGMHD